jgi:hypothetical protein
VNPALPHCRSWAREFGCHVLCPLVERFDALPANPDAGKGGRRAGGDADMRMGEGDDDGGSRSDGQGQYTMYNAAVLVGRAGEVVGVYRKIFPTYGSYEEAGITPAPDAMPQVWVTDFGRVGVLLCFDINFPELWAHLDLEEAAADVVLYPSAMAGTRLLRAYSTIHNYYIVENGEAGRFFDIDGSELAPMHQSGDGLVRVAVLDLDRRLVHVTDPHNGGRSHLHRMLEHPDYLKGVLHVEKRLDDVDMWLLGSAGEGVSVRRELALLQLQDVRAYRRRARRLLQLLRRRAQPCPGLEAGDFDLEYNLLSGNPTDEEAQSPL